jgi:hypothetical protein
MGAGERRATAVAGITAFVTTVATVVLYFTQAGPPSLQNVLTRSFIGLFSLAALLVFMAGLQESIRTSDAPAHFALSVGQAAGLLFVGIGLVALSNEAGVAFGTPNGSVDPTLDGPLAMANILAHGSIKRLLTALYLISMSHAVIRSGSVPRWIGTFGYVIAAVNLAFVPALFFGTDVTRFYSAYGWGNSALTGSLIIWWVLAVSVVLLRSTPGARTKPAASESALPTQG